MNFAKTNRYYDKSNNYGKYYLVLFIIWPFLAFISALANYNTKEAKRVVYFFLVYYGFSYYIGSVYMDSYSYVERLIFNASRPFSDFFNIVGGMYASETSVDIVEPLISFLVSRFTTNYAFLFASYAALFGFFYLKSINLLYDQYKQRPGYNTLIFMIFFIFILPITNINGFRMWTAAWIFFYGAYHVILYRKHSFFLITLGACLVHWSFLSANLILIAYYFAGNRNLVYYFLILLSFILPNLLVPFVSSFSYGGAAIQNRVSGYTSEGYMQQIQESHQQAVWFLTLRNDLIFYLLILAILFIGIFARDLMKSSRERNLYSFLLLFMAFVNFGKGIPSFGIRFQVIFILFATTYVFLYFMKLPGNKINLLTLITLFPMLLYIAVELRIGSDVINSWMFTPGVGVPFLVEGLPLADFFFEPYQ